MKLITHLNLRYIWAAFLFFIGGITIHAQNFTVPIQVSNGTLTQTINVGVSPSATNNFDTGIDVIAPPAPPSGFYASMGASGNEFYTDIRSNLIEEKVYKINFRFNEDASGFPTGNITFSWNSALFQTNTSSATFVVGTSTTDLRTVNTLTLSAASFGSFTFGQLKFTPQTTALPSIGLNPSSLSYTTALNANPAAQSFSISNTGGGTLDWTATDDAPWLTLSPTTGTGTGTVTASVNANGLTAGSYNGTITISATGATSKTLTVSLAVTAPTNQPPVVANAIADQTLTVGGVAFTRDLTATPAVFSDPDNDALTFTVNVSNPNIATATLSGTTLTINPVAAGTATITVTANDGKGGTVNTSFIITATTVTGSLVAHYTCDGNVNDSSGKGNNGIGTNITFATDRFGVANKACSFAGVDNPSHIRVANNTTLQFQSAATIAGYVKLSSLRGMDVWGNAAPVGVHCFFAKDHDRSGLHILLDSNPVSLGIGNQNYGVNFSSGYTSNINPTAQWFHVAYVMGNNAVKIYVNGALVKTEQATIDFTVTNGRDMYWGKYSDEWYPFNGLMDDLRVYNYALTDAEVGVLYQPAVANVAPVVANAIADQTLTAGGAAFTRDLTATPAVFSDPDNDALTFTVNVSNPNIATATLSGTTLTVNPVAAGTATITVTSNDGKGGTVNTSFVVTVNATATPSLSVTPATQTVVAGGGSSTFSVSITNSTGTPTCASNATWLTVTTCSVTQVTATIAANTSSTARTGMISITVTGATGSPATVTVEQAAATATPTLSVTPAKQTVVAGGGTSTFAVSITNSTGTPTCASNATWLTVTTCSATQVITQATANTGSLRSGTVTVTLAGATGSPATVTVEQAAGSTSNDPALVIGNASGRIGQPVNIPILVSKFTGVGAITLKVVFDPSILTFSSVINPPTGITFTANAVNGVLTLIWFDATGGSNLINIASGKLCDLVFTYNGGTGNVSVSALQSEIADKDGVKLNVSFTGGQVALSKASVAGKTVYASTSAAPLAGMSVSLTPSGASALNAVSDTDGNFRFDNLPDGGAVLKATKTGGWNEAANGTDAFQGARLAAGLGSFSPLQQLAADVNNSGSVNGTDAFLIARRATGLTSSFTRGDWVCEEKSLTIANNDQSEDIKCLAVGDVNMSYTPSGIATRALYKTEMARSLALQNVIIGNGAKNFTIPVMVKEFTDVGAITLKISFDASLMSFNKVSGTPAGVAFTSNAANGILTLIWFDASGGSNPVNIADGKLLDIEFNLIGGSSLGVTRSISINKNASEVSDTNGNPLSITYIDASATLLNDQGDEVSSGFSLAGIYPNPFYATTTVQFNLPSSSLVSLKVYDLMGRQIWQKEAEMVVSGSGHQIQIEATGWSSGTYLVVLTAQYGNQTLVEKSKIVFVK